MTCDERIIREQLELYKQEQDDRAHVARYTLEKLAYGDCWPTDLRAGTDLPEDDETFLVDFLTDTESIGSWYHAPMGDQRILNAIYHRERGEKAARIAKKLGFLAVACDILEKVIRANSKEEFEYEKSMDDYWRHG